jgi:PAS domain S-box-containing protein
MAENQAESARLQPIGLRPARRERVAQGTARRAPKKQNLPGPHLKDEMISTFNTLASDTYCVLDGELNCLYISENWSNISGFDASGDMGEGFRSRIAPDHTRKISAYLAGAEASAAPVRFQIKHEDGQWRWCELQMGESDGRHHNCLLRDVTEWVAMQGKLEKSRLEAELATKSRSEFLANMSHELRTPLNAILGFAQMMEAGTYGEIGHPKYNDYIGNIQQSGSTLLSKVNDLLEIANIDAGRMMINEGVVDVGQAIRQAIEFHSHRAFCKQITLRNHLPEQPVLVRADRIRLLQVLTNLIANAIAHSNENGNVDVYCSLRKDGGVNIAVRDNGGGIAPSHLENILTAFQQDNSFFARTRDCVGLGLALSKEIVKLHQGSIGIESKLGEGTLLTIRLPRERNVTPKRLKLLEPAKEAALH